MKVMMSRQFGSCVSLVAIGVMLQSAGRVEAQVDTGMNVPAGNWTSPGDWSAGVPGSDDDAFIGSGSFGLNIATCTLSTAGQECDRLYIGHLAGSSGQLDFTGGSLKVFGAGNDPDTSIGERGVGVVNHSGGTWDNGGNLFRIGDGTTGVGEYNLTGGVVSNVSAFYVAFDGIGTLNISNGGTLRGITAGTQLGYNPSASGVVNVATGGTWDNGGKSLTVGYDPGSYGRLDISGDGVVTNMYRLYLGRDGNGTVTLSDSAEFSGLTSEAYVGYSAGTGTVNQMGGTWDGGGQHMRIGYASNSVGTFAISSGTITNAGYIYAGDNGNGTFDISGDAAVHATKLYISNSAGSEGLLSIAGSGATIWTTEFRAANLGSGTLRITPDSAGISTINLTQHNKTWIYKTTLEVDFSNYDSTNDLTIIDYVSSLRDDGSGYAFAATNILTAGWFADVDYLTDGEVRLVNITRPPKGFVMSIR
jgi:T5SS/PEP-CTERM-associated repeat protein